MRCLLQSVLEAMLCLFRPRLFSGNMYVMWLQHEYERIRQIDVNKKLTYLCRHLSMETMFWSNLKLKTMMNNVLTMQCVWFQGSKIQTIDVDAQSTVKVISRQSKHHRTRRKINTHLLFMTRFTFYGWRGLGANEVEWNGKAETRWVKKNHVSWHSMQSNMPSNHV